MKKPTGNTMLSVKIMAQKGSSALVEYVSAGVLHRRYVPAEKLNGNAASLEVLECGIPYGYPWEEVSLQFDPLRFAKELHNAGIWTAQDALKNPQGIHGALRATLADGLSAVLDTARLEIKRSK